MQNHPMNSTARFTQVLIVGAALLCAAALSPSTRAYAAEKGPQVSAKLAKPLKEAQDDIKNKNYPAAIAKLKEADGMAGKTPYDQHVINQFLTYCYTRTQQYAEAVRPGEAQLNDGFTPESEKGPLMRELVGLNYQIKDYDKVIELGNQTIKAGHADEQVRTLVGQAYYLKGDWKGTVHYQEALVDGEIKNGQTPKNDSLLLLYSGCQKLNDQKCETSSLEKLVAYYPKPEYWSQLLYSLRQETSTNEPNLLQTYRLMFEVDVLKEPGDYAEMAQLALDQGSPGEAQQVLDRGFSRNVFTDQRVKERNQRTLDRAKKQAVTDQASLPKVEKEADAATVGAKNIGVGIAYLGYQQYDKAVDQFTKGITKGSLRSEPEAHLLLGIAQFKATHKDEATKAFKSVKGDPTLERLANLWAIHAREGASKTASAAGKPAKKGAKVAKRA